MHYMAPEVESESEFDQGADIFSFGVTWYRLSQRGNGWPEKNGASKYLVPGGEEQQIIERCLVTTV